MGEGKSVRFRRGDLRNGCHMSVSAYHGSCVCVMGGIHKLLDAVSQVKFSPLVLLGIRIFNKLRTLSAVISRGFWPTWAVQYRQKLSLESRKFLILSCIKFSRPRLSYILSVLYRWKFLVLRKENFWLKVFCLELEEVKLGQVRLE
jgi:hypothetical protein